jgi:hypothetical protein
MKNLHALLLMSALLPVCSIACQADEKTEAFTGEASLVNWEISGAVVRDNARNHGEGTGASLKIGAGGKAIWNLRPSDGSGRVEMWIYDDMTAPSEPKKQRSGPRWGLIQNDGRVLVMGALYARYLSGNQSYATSDSDQKNWHRSIQYSSLMRASGWQKWTFDFDANKGLSISLNAKKARFDWNLTKFTGFKGVAVFGDEAGDNPQTIWVDDVSVQLGEAVKVAPIIPPAISYLPESDPKPDKPVDLLPAVRNKHPRLLFTADQIPTMRKFAQGEGKEYYNQLLRYLTQSVAPTDMKWQTNETEAIRQGSWRLPTVALHYVLTGNQQSFDRSVEFLKKFMATEKWQLGREEDTGMGAANIMTGAALAYDWLYNDLDPQFREEFRKKLLFQARKMYYQGHLMKAPGVHYWQQETQNNHRWHANSGLALSVLAIAGDGPEDDWILSKTFEELKYVADWLPVDGSSHESSGYQIFGMPYLVAAYDAADRCLGTDFLRSTYFKNVPGFRMQALTPGLKDVFNYGDSEGAGYFNNSLFRLTGVNKLADEQAALEEFFKATPSAGMYGWYSLVWFDSSLQGGSISNLPLTSYYPDNGLALWRDGWGEKNVGAMLKCGPYGGATLNKFRNERNFLSINVAHDDPDANSFSLYADGALVADTDHYSQNKVTSSHNTILVNGKGQKGEGQYWMQPLKGQDMNKLASIVNRVEKGDVSLIEGEAGGAYPDLTRYRRTVIWMKGGYILLLDDIRSEKENLISWLMQGKQLIAVDGHKDRWKLQNGEAKCEFQVVSDIPLYSKIGVSTADHRGKSMNLQQLQMQANASDLRVATLFDPWKRALKVSLEAIDSENAKITVKGTNLNESWQWQAAPDAKSKAQFILSNTKGKTNF